MSDPLPPTTRYETVIDYPYNAPASAISSLYLSEALKRDQALVDTWTVDTNGILIMTGLFSATVAAFIVESYKDLKPDSGDTAVMLLALISQQLANGTSNPDPTSIAASASFRPPPSAVRVNTLWFLSLVLSISCALCATLIQQWARRYMVAAQHRAPPQKQARTHMYLSIGLTRFRMMGTVQALPGLLHISVFLFFAGLVEFLYPINRTVAHAVLAFVVVGASVYLVLTFLPLVFLNSPYQTPMTTPLRPVIGGLLLALGFCAKQSKQVQSIRCLCLPKGARLVCPSQRPRLHWVQDPQPRQLQQVDSDEPGP
ncbi:hypothetical protein FA95DRAFT_1236416 [Auriscalpium vulgare]|uniref:Uncharacterized protein n=1 Tax=Auriscalpium vulgare TaxID=40419 RepID=A0ACB8S805_9AGAM|nr:hypothetical protein FA95DRAFT_1236416 [Auriscalpium vulgare]